ncbi:MAG: SRPBCC family protein [Solirubrobacteraceae bacterium]
MSTVSASITIAAPPKQVWQVAMDPKRLADWVTIHRRLRHSDGGPPRVGYEMEQQLHLRGVSVDVHWQLVECTPCRLAVWEGRGPARSSARTEYALAAADGESHTRFAYRNEFRAPLGPLGALASRALIGGMPEREAERSLQRLKALLERDR